MSTSVQMRVRLKGFFLVSKSHQHARGQVSSCLSFLDPNGLYSRISEDRKIFNESIPGLHERLDPIFLDSIVHRREQLLTYFRIIFTQILVIGVHG
jgi:hypothetical protein